MLRMIRFELKKMYANSVVIGSLAVLLLICFLILQVSITRPPLPLLRTVHNYPAEKRLHSIRVLRRNIPEILPMIRLQKWF